MKFFSYTYCLKQSFHYLLLKKCHISYVLVQYTNHFFFWGGGGVLCALWPLGYGKLPQGTSSKKKETKRGVSCHVLSHHSPCRTYNAAKETCNLQMDKLILLMENILHQLIGRLSHYLQGFVHPRWLFGISSINSSSSGSPIFQELPLSTCSPST